MPGWLEVSLVVDGELAEAVAEVIARYIPNGVVIESTTIASDQDHPEGYPIGPVRVAGYLALDDQTEQVRQRLEEALWYLGRIRPLPQPEFRPIEQTDWSQSWKQHYQPIAVGKRLMITPAWIAPPTEERIPILIDPGMAFGTGTHPTTQLCLKLIETILSSPERPDQVTSIDIGCGSGILSIAALKLGASRALGLDIDPEAIQSARKNAEINSMGAELVLEQGSLTQLQAGDYTLVKATLVVANILAPIIIQLLDAGLGDLLEPGGNLLLSGILEEQVQDVEAAVHRNGLQVVERLQQGDWVALQVIG